MPKRNYFTVFFLLFVFCACPCMNAFAKELQSRYFTIDCLAQADTAALAKELDVKPSLQLPDMIDSLFIRLCDILDMHLYSFQGRIVIADTQNEVASACKAIFDQEVNSFGSFYHYDSNSIFVSAQNFNQEALGHAIAEAIVSNYFVVQPSPKIIGIIVEYADNQLRQSSPFKIPLIPKIDLKIPRKSNSQN